MKQPSPDKAPKAEPPASSVPDFVARFPLWPWACTKTEFPWRPKIPRSLACPTKWPFELEDWLSFRSFFSKLCWRVCDDVCFSTTELACLFWWRGHEHSQLQANTSLFLHLIHVFRVMLKYLPPSDNCQPFPGVLDSKKNKCCGRELPKGLFVGADVYMTDSERFMLVQLFDDGAGRSVSSWDMVLPVQ